MRAVEGGAHAEAAELESKAVAVEFIKVQEEALNEADLPMSRRQHVRRYFHLLRERLEE